MAIDGCVAYSDVLNCVVIEVDDNGNLKSDKAIILSGVTGSISTGESRIYFGNRTSDYYS